MGRTQKYSPGLATVRTWVPHPHHPSECELNLILVSGDIDPLVVVTDGNTSIYSEHRQINSA